MLGRAADNLFWMARNMERAENVIRLIRTSRRGGLLAMPETEGKIEDIDNIWMIPLIISGTEETFFEEYEAAIEGPVTAYMLTEKDNPASVRSLLAIARENARATRHLLTSDVWECINRTWLSIEKLTYRDVKRNSIDDHLEWMVDRAYMFKGVMAGSMRRGEGLQFANLGLALERADNTARLLGHHFNVSELNYRKAKQQRTISDYYHSMVLLNALNAYKAYREAFASRIEMEKIAELLILHPEVPRSLRACVDEMADIVRTLNPTIPALEEIYNLQYRLQSVQISQLMRVGLDRFLEDFSAQIDDCTVKIQQDFMMVQ